jgi:hypothetical protein
VGKESVNKNGEWNRLVSGSASLATQARPHDPHPHPPPATPQLPNPNSRFPSDRRGQPLQRLSTMGSLGSMRNLARRRRMLAWGGWLPRAPSDIPWRPRTSAWARCWRRWSEPANSAARPRVGNGSSDHPRGAFPFPIEKKGTERSSTPEPRRHRMRTNRARRRLRQTSYRDHDGASAALAWVRGLESVRCAMVRKLSVARAHVEPSPRVLGERGAWSLFFAIAAALRATRLSFGQRPQSCPCIKPPSIFAIGSAATYPGFAAGDGLLGHLASTPSEIPSPR